MKNNSARAARKPDAEAPSTDSKSVSHGSKGSRRYVCVALASIALGAGIAWHLHSTAEHAPQDTDVAPAEEAVMTDSSGRPLDDAFKQAVQADARRTQRAAAAR